MEQTDLSARSAEALSLPAALTAPPRSSTRSVISRASDYLQDSTRIGIDYTRAPKYRRYVDLRRNEMYSRLVTMYTQQFRVHWQQIKRTVEQYVSEIPHDVPQQEYCARVYVSAWFYDLYVSNREACKKLSDLAYTEHYRMDLVHKSTEYDAYLSYLNAQIRPTNLKLTHEDTLYIPRINQKINERATNDNYFTITNWEVNQPLLHYLIYVMKDRKLLKMEALSETSTGRPSWLFDWHDDGLAYAWFPSEANYTFDDVTIAYILGVACTPKLAPRDYDEWQIMPGNIAPANPDYSQFQRARPLTYRGAVEIRVFERNITSVPDSYKPYFAVRQRTTPVQPPPQIPATSQPISMRTRTQSKGGTSKKRKEALEQTSAIGQESSGSAQEAEVNQPDPTAAVPNPVTDIIISPVNYEIIFPDFNEVRIIDYLYHARVVKHIDDYSRHAAFNMLTHIEKTDKR